MLPVLLEEETEAAHVEARSRDCSRVCAGVENMPAAAPPAEVVADNTESSEKRGCPSGVCGSAMTIPDIAGAEDRIVVLHATVLVVEACRWRSSVDKVSRLATAAGVSGVEALATTVAAA
jgi:hypothetical protein